MQRATTAEILLALRSPTANWLAVLTCVLDEANRDARFDAHQRQLAAQLLAANHLPSVLVEAARHRTDAFAADLETCALADAPPVAAGRPKLTLVGQ